MLLYDAGTGELLAVMDGVHLTNVRTAAASAVATQALARPGVEPARADRRRRPGRRPPRGDGARAAARARRRRGADARLGRALRRRAGAALPAARARAVDTPAEALAGADVVCTVSSAREPVVTAGLLEPGTHVNAVGSHAPAIREIDGEVMRDARVVVDSREATLSECGDCMLPIAEGLFGPEHVSDELGEVLAGDEAGPQLGGRDHDLPVLRDRGAGRRRGAAGLRSRALPSGSGSTSTL